MRGPSERVHLELSVYPHASMIHGGKCGRKQTRNGRHFQRTKTLITTTSGSSQAREAEPLQTPSPRGGPHVKERGLAVGDDERADSPARTGVHRFRLVDESALSAGGEDGLAGSASGVLFRRRTTIICGMFSSMGVHANFCTSAKYIGLHTFLRSNSRHHRIVSVKRVN